MCKNHLQENRECLKETICRRSDNITVRDIGTVQETMCTRSGNNQERKDIHVS